MLDPYLQALLGLPWGPKRYTPPELEDIEREYELIQKKKSTLSSVQRQRIVRIWEKRQPKKEISVKEDYPKDKGKQGGSCNRSCCLAPGADHYNLGSYAWYCEGCADLINDSNENLPDVQRDYPNGKLCHTAEKLEELYEDACCEYGCDMDSLAAAKGECTTSLKAKVDAGRRLQQAGLSVPE